MWWNLKMSYKWILYDINLLFTKEKQTHRFREQTWLLGQRSSEKDIRDFGTDIYTLLYFKWITNKNLLYSTGNAAQSYMAAWMRGEFGGEWIHVYVWLSCYAVHLELSKHY